MRRNLKLWNQRWQYLSLQFEWLFARTLCMSSHVVTADWRIEYTNVRKHLITLRCPNCSKANYVQLILVVVVLGSTEKSFKLDMVDARILSWSLSAHLWRQYHVIKYWIEVKTRELLVVYERKYNVCSNNFCKSVLRSSSDEESCTMWHDENANAPLLYTKRCCKYRRFISI